jgi:hypothetical protein
MNTTQPETRYDATVKGYARVGGGAGAHLHQGLDRGELGPCGPMTCGKSEPGERCLHGDLDNGTVVR